MARKAFLCAAIATLAIGLMPPLNGHEFVRPKQSEYRPVTQAEPYILEADNKLAPVAKSSSFCEVNLAGPPAYYISGWTLFAGERYAAYQDAAACGYPFGVTYAYVDLYATAACTANVYVQLLQVDDSDPGCIKPGLPFFASGGVELIFPHSGRWVVSMPLSDTVCVLSPYFAAFGFSSDAACLYPVIDNTPTTCFNYYNYTDDLWEDLVQVYGFPGDLVMHTGGLTPDQNDCALYPPPRTVITRPCDTAYWNDHPYFKDTLAVEALDNQDTSRVISTAFDYFDGMSWHNFYTDHDGTDYYKDPTDTLLPGGDGWTGYWVPTSLPEAYYLVRATMIDALGQSSSDTIVVYYDPDPPVPTIITPEAFNTEVVLPTDIVFTSGADKVKEMDITVLMAPGPVAGCLFGFVKGIPSLEQKKLYPNGTDGENRGCYPTSVAACLKWWAQHGYPNLDSSGTISNGDMVKQIGKLMGTDPNSGTTDAQAQKGAQDYIDQKLGVCKFKVEHVTGKDVTMERYIMELFLNNEDVVPSDHHHVVCANSFCLIPLSIDYMNPWTGLVEWVQGMKQSDGHPMTDMLIISPKTDSTGPVPDTVGTPTYVPGLGYRYRWTDSLCSTYAPNKAYLVEAIIVDSLGHVGWDMVKLELVARGDANGDGSLNIGDAVFIINYIFKGGPAPDPLDAGDANCDHARNVGDAINIINYIFKGGPKPCCY